VDLKNGMNNLRTYYEGYLLSNRMVNQNGLVVFVEASKGERWYFYFSNFSVVFGNTSKKIKKKNIRRNILFSTKYPSFTTLQKFNYS